jgi:hypothetical protein
MKMRYLTTFMILMLFSGCSQAEERKTEVTISGDKFFINGEITLKGRSLDGVSIEGLLPNSRMVQAVFDDLNPETRNRFRYPDTGVWDPDRNTREFCEAVPLWRSYGLLAVTVNLQGGSPTGYGNEGWYNSAFYEDGRLREDYFKRMERVLDVTDENGMVVILGLFYFGQDQNLKDEAAVINAVNLTIDWLHEKKYRHVLIEINNECDVKGYVHEILMPARVHELIDLAKSNEKDGYRFYVSTSYGGNFIPLPNVVKSSDFILIHGNGVNRPERITEMVELTRQIEGYRTMPILFNEDDHYDFDKPDNNMLAAFRSYTSWGYFDFRRLQGRMGATEDEPFAEGFQSVPVDWGVNSDRKKGFFELVAKISGIEVNK